MHHWEMFNSYCRSLQHKIGNKSTRLLSRNGKHCSHRLDLNGLNKQKQQWCWGCFPSLCLLFSLNLLCRSVSSIGQKREGFMGRLKCWSTASESVNTTPLAASHWRYTFKISSISVVVCRHLFWVKNVSVCVVVQCGNQTRMLQHYWYTSWPDHKTPDSAMPLLQLMADVETDRRSATAMGPVIVHCRCWEREIKINRLINRLFCCRNWNNIIIDPLLLAVLGLDGQAASSPQR